MESEAAKELMRGQTEPIVVELEGPAADGVRRVRMKVRIDPSGTMTVIDVEDATEWKETQ